MISRIIETNPHLLRKHALNCAFCQETNFIYRSEEKNLGGFYIWNCVVCNEYYCADEEY